MNEYSSDCKNCKLRKNEKKEEYNNFNPEDLGENELEFIPLDEDILIDKELEFIPKDEMDFKKVDFLFSPKNEINLKNKSSRFEINEDSIPVSIKIRKYHPNIKLDYFEEINTKSKAYCEGLKVCLSFIQYLYLFLYFFL